MINQSDFIIFYVNKTENSGAYKALQYIKKKKKPFINIATFSIWYVIILLGEDKWTI